MNFLLFNVCAPEDPYISVSIVLHQLKRSINLQNFVDSVFEWNKYERKLTVCAFIFYSSPPANLSALLYFTIALHLTQLTKRLPNWLCNSWDNTIVIRVDCDQFTNEFIFSARNFCKSNILAEKPLQNRNFNEIHPNRACQSHQQYNI